MQQTKSAQYAEDCLSWRDALRHHRQEFIDNKKKLQEAVHSSLPKDELIHIEHLHNQFYIQLINIHDLKKAIKSHGKIIEATGDKLNEHAKATHRILANQFQDLHLTIEEINSEFHHFINDGRSNLA